MFKKLFLVLVLLVSKQVSAQSIGDYRSFSSGDWNSLSTWKQFDGVDFIPATAIPTSADGVITIMNEHNVTISSPATIDQTIVEAGGTLTNTSTLTIADGLGDDVVVNGNFIFTSGTVNGSGSLSVSGGMEWQSGSLQSNITLESGSINSKTTTGNAFIQSYTLTNKGTFNWINGNIAYYYGTFVNGASGVINATGDNQMFHYYGSSNFVNQGVFTKSAGSGTTSISASGSNSGTINVNSGTVSSGGSFTNTGTVYIDTGNTFLVNGGLLSMNNGSVFTGAGNLQLSDVTITVNADAGTPATATNFILTSGTINGAGSISITGGMDWQSGSIATNMTLELGSINSKTTAGGAIVQSYTLTNKATFNWINGNIGYYYGTFVNEASGVINATGDNQMFLYYGSSNFVNQGVFTKSVGSGTTSISASGSNSGTINVNSGTVSSGGSFTNTGTVYIDTGNTFLVNGGLLSMNNGSVFTGAGNLQLSDVTITVNADAGTPATATNFILTSGTINGAGSISITGGMDWQSGTIATNMTLELGSINSKTTTGVAYIQSYTLTNKATFNWENGNIGYYYGTFINEASGVINATGDNQMFLYYGSSNFTNNGVFTKSVGTGTTTFSASTSNSGTINLNSGTISSSGSYVNTGTVNIGTGKTFLVNGGTFSMNDGSVFTGAGNLQLSGATITVNATLVSVPNFIFTSGTVNGAGLLSITGTMDWQTGTMQANTTLETGSTTSKTTPGAAYIFNGTLTNKGTFNWENGDFYYGYGNFVNDTMGVINATGDNQMAQYYGTSNFENHGVFTKSGGTGTTVFYANGSNSGTINLNSGTISTIGSFVDSGTINIDAGRTFLVNGGTFYINDGSVFPSVGNLQLSGVTITVNAALAAVPNFIFTSGTVNGAGLLSITGTMDWQTGTMQANTTLETGSTTSKTTSGAAYIFNGTLTNKGTFNWENGDFYYGYGTFINDTTGVINATGDNQMAFYYGSSNFTNNGVFTKSLGTTTSFSVAMSNSGTFNGNGTLNIAGSFTNNGTISPGLSPGILTINTNQPFSENSNLQIEIKDGGGAGIGHDQIARAGNLTLSGALNITETGTPPAISYTIVNLSSGAISGSFTTINKPANYQVVVNSNSVVVNVTKMSNFAEIPAFDSGTTAPILPTTSPNGVTGTWSPATISNTASGDYVFTPDLSFNTGQTLHVTVNSVIPTSLTFCKGAKVSDAVGTSTLKFYASATKGTALASTIAFATKTYYVTQTVNGLETTPRTAVPVTVNLLPVIPSALVLANGLEGIKKVGNFIATSTALTLTATATGAVPTDHYNWTLTNGVHQSAGGSTGTITVDFAAVTPGNTAIDFFVSSVSATGCVSKTAKKLTVTRLEPGKPKALVLTDALLPLVSKITKLDAYTGALNTRTLTLTAEPETKAGSQASSYKWVLPAGVTTTADATATANTYTSTLPTIDITLAGITNESTFLFQVYGVNGNGESVLSKDLKCSSAAPKTPGAITTPTLAKPTYGTTCNNVVTVQVPSVLGATYAWSVSGGATITSGQGFNSIVINTAGASATLTISVTASNGSGPSLPKILTLKKTACGVRIAPESVTADEFKVIAYPNPSSSEFTIEASSKGATNVQVYDMTGRLIENRQSTSNSVQVGRNYASGVYNVIVNQGAQVKTLRLIKK